MKESTGWPSPSASPAGTAGPGAGHMEKLVVTIQDREHRAEEWSFVESGKVTHTGVFHFTRKK